MRASDPFEDLDVDQGKAVLLTALSILLAIVYAFLFPTQAAVVAVILSFFLIIMLHETGHFVAAKRAGMKVTEFFVGFGPRLWSFRRGETEYGIKAVPLGGYGRLTGMTSLEDVALEDEPRAYRAKPWHSKVVVAGAGPAVHFVLATILMFTVLFLAGDFRNASVTTTLGGVAQGAQAAGLQPGDRVVSINGTKITSWSQVPALINPPNEPAKAGSVVAIEVVRGGVDKVVHVTLNASSDPNANGRVVAGISPHQYLPHPGLVESVVKAPRQVAEVTWDSVKALGSMFSPAGISNYFHILAGDKSKNVDQNKRFVSPAGFGKLATDAVQSGWVNVLRLLIAINVFVGLFNLLPLLPFDGGHIAIATYERLASAVRGRRVQVDVAKLMPLTLVVVAVFGFIALSSLFLDVTRPISNPF